MTTYFKARLCECGCRQPAPLAQRTNARKGHVKGSPLRFVSGHNKPSNPIMKVKRGSGCWSWLGAHTPKGYGRVQWNGVHTGAHRFVYEALVGPIPIGMQLDHLCRNTGCVNPAHLEPVTRAENLRRQHLRTEVTA